MAEPTTAAAVTADGFKIEQCDSCKAPIVWASTGRRLQPVDAQPHPEGYLSVRASALRNMPPLVHKVPPYLAFGRRDLRRAHQQTCPQAEQWKRKSRRVAS